jgi:hypothetical protein
MQHRHRANELRKVTGLSAPGGRKIGLETSTISAAARLAQA